MWTAAARSGWQTSWPARWAPPPWLGSCLLLLCLLLRSHRTHAAPAPAARLRPSAPDRFHVANPILPQLPDCYFWELQYRPLVPGQPLGAWEAVEVGQTMEVTVDGLEPGTRYAFRHAQFGNCVTLWYAAEASGWLWACWERACSCGLGCTHTPACHPTCSPVCLAHPSCRSITLQGTALQARAG